MDLIERKFNLLSEDLKREALNFIDFLIEKKQPKKTINKLSFKWEGGLSKLGGQYSSVDLQHKVADWR